MSTHPPEWQGILDDDERIQWQGHPEHRVRFTFRSKFEPFFYLFYVAFSVFWMVTAALAAGPFWMFGLIFFAVGAYKLVGQHYWKARLRRATFYTLTDKRAFIASNPPFGARKLDSYPITAQTPLRLEEDRGLTTIYFAHQNSTARNKDRIGTIGFELLADGRQVYSTMRQIQKTQVAAQ